VGSTAGTAVESTTVVAVGSVVCSSAVSFPGVSPSVAASVGSPSVVSSALREKPAVSSPESPVGSGITVAVGTVGVGDAGGVVDVAVAGTEVLVGGTRVGGTGVSVGVAVAGTDVAVGSVITGSGVTAGGVGGGGVRGGGVGVGVALTAEAETAALGTPVASPSTPGSAPSLAWISPVSPEDSTSADSASAASIATE